MPSIYQSFLGKNRPSRNFGRVKNWAESAERYLSSFFAPPPSSAKLIFNNTVSPAERNLPDPSPNIPEFLNFPYIPRFARDFGMWGIEGMQSLYDRAMNKPMAAQIRELGPSGAGPLSFMQKNSDAVNLVRNGALLYMLSNHSSVPVTEEERERDRVMRWGKLLG